MRRLLPLLLSANVWANCPQIDPAKKDPDGMPLCPDQVSAVSAYVVYSCALDQANSFHAPTSDEKRTMLTLLQTHEKVLTNGKGPETTDLLLTSSSALGLQMCRVNQTMDGKPDSYLLAYTKPGVKDYSGPFLMLRETIPSKVVIIGPHDDSDNTYASTKKGLAHSHALATISNGHKRGNTPNAPGGKNGDFVHETEGNNLGTFVVDKFTEMHSGSVVLHIHGMANNTKVLLRSRNDKLATVFKKAIVDNTKITQFDNLNADFTIEPLLHTDWYLKTEIPAQIHANNQMIIADIAKAVEAQPWGK